MTEQKNDLGEKFVRGLKSDFAIVEHDNKSGSKEYTDDEIVDSVTLNGLVIRLHRFAEKKDQSTYEDPCTYFEVEYNPGFVVIAFQITKDAELKIVLTDFDFYEQTKMVFGYILEKIFFEAIKNKCKIIKASLKDSKERLDLMEEVFKTYSYEALRTANILALCFDIEKIEIAKRAKVMTGLRDE